MNCLLWNCRGAGNDGFRGHLRYLLRYHCVDILGLLETKIFGDATDRACERLDFTYKYRVEARGFEGGVVNFDDHLIHAVVTLNGIAYNLVVVNAPPTLARTRDFWEELEQITSGIQAPLFMGGDYNCILNQSERLGGSGALSTDSRRFPTWMDNCGLIDMQFSGPLSPRQEGMMVPRKEHVSSSPSKRPFRFEAAWMEDPNFFALISSWWDDNMDTSAAVDSVKHKLLEWNKKEFGNIHLRKKRLMARIEGIQIAFSRGITGRLIALENKLHNELELTMRQEEKLRLQKSRELWLVGGYRNSKFYHVSTVVRRERNKVRELMNENGELIANNDQLANTAKMFFDNLYSLREEERKDIDSETWLFLSVAVDEWAAYLGMQVLHKRVSKHTFRSLVEKVNAMLTGWKCKFLSMAGRVTLAKAVLSSIPVYSMGVVCLLISTYKEIDKIIRGFVWVSWVGHRKLHLVSWKELCRLKDHGGLDLRSMRELNLALIGKLRWRFLNDRDSLPTRCSSPRSNSSHVWKSILCGIRKVVVKGCAWNVGNGEAVSFWDDRWLLDSPLDEVAVGSIDEQDCSRIVASYWSPEEGWNWQELTHILPKQVRLQIPPMVVSSDIDLLDQIRWGLSMDGEYSVGSGYALIKNATQPIGTDGELFKCIWKALSPKKVKMFVWLMVKGGILTNQERLRWHFGNSSACLTSDPEVEDLNHLFRTGFLCIAFGGCGFGGTTWSFVAPFVLGQALLYRVAWAKRSCRMMNRMESERMVIWDCPEVGWIKLNTDGSVKSSGPMSFAEKMVLSIFSVLIVLWMTRNITDEIPGWGVVFNGKAGDGTVSVLMATLLFIIPNKKQKGEKLMDWGKCKGLPWNIILLLGAGFAIADGVRSSGLADVLSSGLGFLAGSPYWALPPAVCVISATITEFTSNNATTTLVVPLLIQIAQTMGAHPLLLMVPGAIGAQLAFLLPTGTPSNIVGFTTNHIHIGDMIKTGLPLKIFAILALSLLMPSLGAYVFGTDEQIAYPTSWLGSTSRPHRLL
ncbi:hypothetical protein V2J09_012278 [Rumex salicifolius]